MGHNLVTYIFVFDERKHEQHWRMSHTNRISLHDKVCAKSDSMSTSSVMLTWLQG